MSNIRFNLAADRSGKPKYITFIYDYVPGKRVKLSTKLKCNPDQWCKITYTVNDSHPQHEYINNLLTKIKNKCMDVKLLFLSQGTHATGVAYRNAIKKIIDPDTHQPADEGKIYSASRYWDRFHEIMPNYPNLKEAYYEVENEWNDVGISMFPTYTAFRAGKSRYLNQKKHINRAKAIK